MEAERGERREERVTKSGDWQRRREREETYSELRQKMQESAVTKTNVTLNGIETEILNY